MSTPESPLPEIQYENDTGPNDEGFWEWWEIPGFGKFDSEENAKRARHCVNTHDALVEALKLLQYEMANCISASASAEFSDEVRVKLSEALRQAEEGK